jgi:hypothetical protein
MRPWRPTVMECDQRQRGLYKAGWRCWPATLKMRGVSVSRLVLLCLFRSLKLFFCGVSCRHMGEHRRACVSTDSPRPYPMQNRATVTRCRGDMPTALTAVPRERSKLCFGDLFRARRCRLCFIVRSAVSLAVTSREQGQAYDLRRRHILIRPRLMLLELFNRGYKAVILSVI